MKAVQFKDVDQLVLAELEVPQIGDDEILVSLRSVGICHSDFELLEGRYIIPFEYPIIPGHEWSGEVAEVGKSVSGFQSGDRVLGECVIGMEHFGFSISGAAAEYFVARPEWLHKVPDELNDTQAALVEPFSCGYFAAMRVGNLNASDTAVVFGAGPIGLGSIAVATALGARVIAAEPNAARGDLARQLGAEEVLDPTSDGFLDQVQAADRGTGSQRCDRGIGPARSHGLDPRSRRLQRPTGQHRHRRRPQRLGQARPDPVQAAADPRHHRLAGRLAGHPALPGPHPAST